MTDYRNILLVLDLSEDSQIIGERAKAIASRFGVVMKKVRFGAVDRPGARKKCGASLWNCRKPACRRLVGVARTFPSVSPKFTDGKVRGTPMNTASH